MLITKSGINERIERFSNLTKEIESGADLMAPKSALQLSPSEQHATYQTLNGPIYQTLSARARAAVLLRLDALMSGGSATYDSDTTTVEHVLPQSPVVGSEWLIPTRRFSDSGKSRSGCRMISRGKRRVVCHGASHCGADGLFER